MVSGKSRSAKNVQEGPLGVFEHPLFCKIEKNEGGPFGDIEKIAKKSLTKPKNLQKNIWSRAGIEPTSFCLTDLKKAVTSMPSASRSWTALARPGGPLRFFIHSVANLQKTAGGTFGEKH